MASSTSVPIAVRSLAGREIARFQMEPCQTISDLKDQLDFPRECVTLLGEAGPAADGQELGPLSSSSRGVVRLTLVISVQGVLQELTAGHDDCLERFQDPKWGSLQDPRVAHAVIDMPCSDSLGGYLGTAKKVVALRSLWGFSSDAYYFPHHRSFLQILEGPFDWPSQVEILETAYGLGWDYLQEGWRDTIRKRLWPTCDTLGKGALIEAMQDNPWYRKALLPILGSLINHGEDNVEDLEVIRSCLKDNDCVVRVGAACCLSRTLASGDPQALLALIQEHIVNDASGIDDLSQGTVWPDRERLRRPELGVMNAFRDVRVALCGLKMESLKLVLHAFCEHLDAAVRVRSASFLLDLDNGCLLEDELELVRATLMSCLHDKKVGGFATQLYSQRFGMNSPVAMSIVKDILRGTVAAASFCMTYVGFMLKSERCVDCAMTCGEACLDFDEVSFEDGKRGPFSGPAASEIIDTGGKVDIGHGVDGDEFLYAGGVLGDDGL